MKFHDTKSSNKLTKHHQELLGRDIQGQVNNQLQTHISLSTLQIFSDSQDDHLKFK